MSSRRKQCFKWWCWYFFDQLEKEREYAFKVNELHSIFSIEALAIEKVLLIIKEKIETYQINLTTRIVIVTDSYSVLEAIKTEPTAAESFEQFFLYANFASHFYNNIHVMS